MQLLLGIDIGGTNLKLAFIDRHGRLLKGKRIFSTADFKGKDALINKIAFEVQNMFVSSGINKKDVIGAGVGVPGAVNVKNGIAHYLTNIPGWREVPIGNSLKKKLGIPVFVDNDVNVMALGEFFFGAGKGARNMLCVTLGTGVGGGLILNGELYRGSSCAAGEFGHMPISIDGPKCNCGSSGCIEAYVGKNYIIRKAAAMIRKGSRTLIKELTGGDISKLTPELISRAAGRGDKFAKDIWEDTGEKIGIALAGVVNLLNPEKIIIGGGIANAGNVLFNSIRKTIAKRAMRLPAKTVRVVKARLGYDAGVIGAAALVLYELKGKRL